MIVMVLSGTALVMTIIEVLRSKANTSNTTWALLLLCITMFLFAYQGR